MKIGMLVNGLIIASAIAVGVYVTQEPWREYDRQVAKTREKVKAMNVAEERRVDLLAAADRAESQTGKEERVRAAGYIGPGEIAQVSVEK